MDATALPDMPTIPEVPEVKGDASKVLRYVNTMLLALGAFFAINVWNTQQEQNRGQAERLEKLQDSVGGIKTDMKVTEANRFTAIDWNKAKENIDERHNTLDRRLGKLEDSQLSIKDSLLRIEHNIGTKP